MTKPPKKRLYVSSSSFKMALLFTILCGGSVLILGYFSIYFERDNYINWIDNALESEMSYVTYWEQRHPDELPALVNDISTEQDRAFFLYDQRRNKIAGNLNAVPQEVDRLKEGTFLFSPTEGSVYAAKILSFESGLRLLIGTDITALDQKYRNLRLLSFLSIGLMILIILTSFFISTFVVSRSNRIASTARRIMATGDLSQRIEIDSKWDDLSFVSEVLNQFLDRLEELVNGIQRVSDNIAHDLRTPLTRMRNGIEALEKMPAVQGNEAADLQARKLLSECDQLLNTFSALLRITRIETGKQKSAFSTFSARPMLEDVIDLYDPIAEDKGITVESYIRDLSFHGDRNLLFQCFANLLDNAIKFTPPKGHISVNLTQNDDGHIAFCIADTGKGVAEDDLYKIFDRFYRTEECRHTPGNGLGLSLVRAVADLHNASIDIKNMTPGLCITLTFKGEQA